MKKFVILEADEPQAEDTKEMACALADKLATENPDQTYMVCQVLELITASIVVNRETV